jgi:hypothetical protein
MTMLKKLMVLLAFSGAMQLAFAQQIEPKPDQSLKAIRPSWASNGSGPETWDATRERQARALLGEDVSVDAITPSAIIRTQRMPGGGTMSYEVPNKPSRSALDKILGAEARKPEPSAVPLLDQKLDGREIRANQTTTLFEAANFDTNATVASGSLSIPPDSSGAVGPNHVVNVFNIGLQIFSKTGTQLSQVSLATFFTVAVTPPGYVNPTPPSGGMFDPKVIYDQEAGRFVVVALSGAASASSRIYVAVSTSNDPTGTWNYGMISGNVLIGSTNHWSDFPGVGMDTEALYITNNVFSVAANAFGGVRLWIVPKEPFYSGGVFSNAIYDPIALATGDATIATTTSPALRFGGSAGDGNWMVQYSGLSDGTNEFFGMFRVRSPLSAPTFEYRFVNLGDVDNTAVALPAAAQRGTGILIASNDRRVSNNPVWRGNDVYAAATTLPASGADAGQSTARWWRINVSGTLPALGDSGAIGGEDLVPGAVTTFPSIAVDAAGNLGIGMSVSAPTLFASAAYTTRLSTDPAGTTEPLALMREGTDYYQRRFGGTLNRWGDYSGTASDPSTGRFWSYNQYAATRGTVTATGQDGRYGTAWGEYSPLITAALLTRRTVTSSEDPSSNLNGSIEPGEAGRLTIALENTGAAAATAISATVSAVTPGIVMLNATRTYADIAVDSSVSNALPFRFRVPGGAPCADRLEFLLTVTHASGSASFPFEVGIGPSVTSPLANIVINEILDATAPAAIAGVSVTTGQTSQFRLNRDSLAQTCAAPKSSLGLAGTAGVRRYDAYTLSNPGANASCVTITHATSCVGANDQFGALYFPSFNPNDQLANWRGDGGSSPSATGRSYSTLVPARSSFTVVVSEVNVGGSATCGAYTLTIAGASSGTCAAFSGNTAPTISPAPINRQAGSPASVSTIATVDDAESAPGSLTVTAPTVPAELTVSAITNSAGSISASVGATCSATVGLNTVGLDVSDGALNATASLAVNVSANTPPTLGAYSNTSVAAGASTTVSPASAPGDNGSTVLTVAAVPSFSGTLSVSPSGVVSVGNAGPAGNYTVTVTSTDNCGATATSAFTLAVTGTGTDPVITPVSVARAQGSPWFRSTIATVSDAGGAGAVTVTVNGGGAASNNGVEIKSIQNLNGTISALLRAGCAATNASFTLSASNGSNSNSSPLNVAVSPSGNPVWCQWWPR